MSVAQSLSAISSDVLKRFQQARERSDELFQVVRKEHRYDRPIPERHRIVFYIGHLEAFDWNLFRERLFHADRFDPALDRLFAFGIDPVSGRLPNDQPSDWPGLEAVTQYVAKVRERIDRAIKHGLPDATTEEILPSVLLQVAIEHRLMHCETLAYMLHQLPISSKIPQSQIPEPSVSPHTPSMVRIPAGQATLGLNRNTDIFGWDNEFEEYSVEVPEFEIDRYKVSNGEFLNFLQAGGYENRELWGDENWRWKTENKITHPAFWRKESGKWSFRAMFEEKPLPPDWPVYVSHAEASAYARWLGKELPTEAQWHRAAYGTDHGGERAYPWGSERPSEKRGNFDFMRWDPVPVQAHGAGASAFGVSGMLGNGWEWTSSVFGPFPGFERFPFYLGYSADFFDGKHYVMKGASARTAECMLRPSFRNWFQNHYQYVYAGFRCVNS